jgi:hypothetical protein
MSGFGSPQFPDSPSPPARSAISSVLVPWNFLYHQASVFIVIDPYDPNASQECFLLRGRRSQ